MSPSTWTTPATASSTSTPQATPATAPACRRSAAPRRWPAYFRAHGLRYLAFVRTEQSRYFYRRAFWVQRILIDVEIWRIVGAYMVDTIDNFAELAERYPTLYDQDGMVVVDLAAPREAAR
jgi:hypothetical protein